MTTDARVAIVTGAGGMRGIGRAIALRLARGGFRVGLVDVRVAADQRPAHEIAAGWRGIESVRDEIAKLGGEAILLWADISDAGQIDEACAQTIARFGRILVLQVLVDRTDPLCIERRHVRMEQRRWFARVGEFFCQFSLAGFQLALPCEKSALQVNPAWMRPIRVATPSRQIRSSPEETAVYNSSQLTGRSAISAASAAGTTEMPPYRMA